jgi:hypothetical protein
MTSPPKVRPYCAAIRVGFRGFRTRFEGTRAYFIAITRHGRRSLRQALSAGVTEACGFRKLYPFDSQPPTNRNMIAE